MLAIFRRTLRREDEQARLTQRLAQDDWDLCYVGHASSVMLCVRINLV